MHRLQNAMLLLVDLRNPQSSRPTPSQEDNAISPDPSNEINDLLRETLPAMFGMAICLVCPNSKTCVEHENTTLRPRRQ